MQGHRQNSASSSGQSRAERNPFRRAISIAYNPRGQEIIEELDMETLKKQERAIRAFTQSVEYDDMPLAPELPPSLDIDQYGFGMKESSTADTIIDVAKLAAEQEQVDKTKGETQKYRMAVPGPEQVDQEIELHKSLIKNAEPDEESIDENLQTTPDTNANYSKRERPTTVMDADSQALRRQYSSSAVQRPRPTTPTSWCAIDAYVQANEERSERRRSTSHKNKMPPDSGAKIRVLIPNKERAKTGQRERRNSMSWSDFYESMEQPAYKHSRSESMATSNVDFDTEWENAKTSTDVWNEKAKAAPQMADQDKTEKVVKNEEEEEQPRRSSTQSDRRASQISKDSDTQKPASPPKASTPTENADEQQPSSPVKTEDGHVKPVRAAPPPPPGSKKVPEETAASNEYPTTEAPIQSEFGDPSQFYQGYGGEAYGAVGYDPSTYTDQNYDYSNYAAGYDATATSYDQSAYGTYDQTQYDPNAYAGYNTTGYENYYQGYGDYNTTDQSYNYDAATAQQQGYTYDPNTGQYTYDYSQAANYDYSAAGYDPNLYNAGYDQQGLQTTSVGADDTDTSASVSPRPDASPNVEEASTTEDEVQQETAIPETANYDYSQYSQQDYSAYSTTDYNTNVTVNEPDAFDTSQYGTENQQDYSSYGAQVDTSQYGTENQQDYSSYGTQVDTSQYGTETDYSQYGAQTDTSQYETEFQPPVLQPTLAPLLPQQRARTPDPFGWEAQEKSYNETGSAMPPPRPPPMAKTPEVETISIEPAEQIEQEEEETKAEPPSRPAPPSAIKQPPRPPPPPSQASPSKMPPPPMPPPPSKTTTTKKEEEEEDPWARFKQMSDQVGNIVKSTEQQLKNLSETTAAKDVKDESYIAQIGGTQGTDLTAAQKQILKMQEEQKKAKADKKARKSASSKKNVVPQFDPKKEEDVEAKAAELVAKMMAQRAHDLEGWKPPTEIAEKIKQAQKSPETPESPEKIEEAQQEEEQKEEEPVEERRESVKSTTSGKQEEEKPKEEEVVREGWAAFDTKFSDATFSFMPKSESDFFSSNAKQENVENAFGEEQPTENGEKVADPFAPTISAFDADPFDTRPVDEIVAEAKQRAELEGSLQPDDSNLLHGSPATTRRSTSKGSTPTEGGSPVSARPMGFEDDFKADYSHTPTPLYDEDDTQPLEEFTPKFAGDGWDLMIRHPIKKKSFMSERCWKPCFVRLREGDNMLRVFNAKDDDRPILEILLQGSYSLSETTLQAYDQYGKIHTVKLQHVLYKERVGIRAGQISRLVEGHITKYGLPLEHAAQINVLAKFACLNTEHLQSFVSTIEDILFHCTIKRDSAPFYRQDEVQIHCYDEYKAHVDKLGNVSNQRARVRMFCLSFLSGSPFLEIGLNDRRREGKEIVRRKDILPMYTERWIRFEGLEFHNTVEQSLWDEDQVIKLTPPDACFFEVMRFRIRPPKNREKPLTVKSIMKIAGSKVEIRIDVMAAAQHQLAKGTVESTRSIPCEDIQVRFPIPDAWIYIFREERTWGVGSVHSKTRRPGKVKNLKDRLMGAVQHTENTLIEVAIGEAKYEHVHRSLVWRIPRLPEKHHQAYKSHLLKCRFQLSSFDLMPEEFLPTAQAEFTMPLATISNTVVRSISVEQHEDSDRVEKFVRYVAKCHYDLDIDYVQCNNLDNELDMGTELTLQKHEAIFNPDEIKAQHEGYKIDVDESKVQSYGDGDEHVHVHQEQPIQSAWDNNTGAPPATFDFDSYARQGNGEPYGARKDSSSEEEEDKDKFPVIQIDMSSYGY